MTRLSDEPGTRVLFLAATIALLIFTVLFFVLILGATTP